MPLASLEEALEDIQQGKCLIVVDDERRENEGDLVMPAEKMTPEAVNFMVTHAKGLLCMPIIGERLDELEMPLMVNGHNTATHSTAFTVSVDYRKGTTTGISAHDRAATIKAMIDPKAKPDEFARPGHLFPLRYQEGGVLVRAGHTEAAVDLARLAGMYPAGIVCEILNPDGTMARMPELEELSRKHDLNIISIAQIIAHRRRHERLIEKVAEARLPTVRSEFQIIAYKSMVDPGEHLAMVKGEWEPGEPVLVRIHSECLTGDVFGSVRCDCGEQMQLALDIIAKGGKGVFLYMRQEGRGIGLHNKIKAYSLQDHGMDTIEANEELGFESDLRHYGIAAQILAELGVKRMRFLTNNPRKMVGLSGYDLEIVERVPIEAEVKEENRAYLQTKRSKMGHTLEHC
ncbi:MAG: bifunctional 3,4-dihydroxy-2-butanone-4-phosphate synthase/GTP cyclohydrolase II [Dehalococcoidia bacterium]|nr:bifunctional 3,4-dihydroxy-2-butanone-4-phosphate synthase/GTP cyclohydrolase II [Dehalococcoidia bacterium]